MYRSGVFGHRNVGRALLAATVALTILLLPEAEPAGAHHAPVVSVAHCTHHRNAERRSACIIAAVFYRHGQSRKAVSVAWCESRLDPAARNGQYRGVFQMGAAERARYGHGRTVLAQARAARRYYAIAGWTPWACA